MNRAQFDPEQLYSGGFAWWIAHDPAKMRADMAGRVQSDGPRGGRRENSGLIGRILTALEGVTQPHDSTELRERAQFDGSPKQFMEALTKATERGLLERFGSVGRYRYRKAEPA